MRTRSCFPFALSVAVLALSSARAQTETLATDILRDRGVRAYTALPDNPTLASAPRFSEALSYLFAYEQRMTRDGGSVAPGINAAYEWMIERLDNFKTGKGDFTPDILLRRGLEQYQAAKSSERERMIWNVRAFLAATANLYAYIQNAPSPTSNGIDAYNWLVASRTRLVVSGIAADAPGRPTDESWRPTRAKPRIAGRGRGALAGRQIGGAAVGAVEQPAAAVDSTRALRAEYERMRVALGAATAENDSLRRANAELRRRLGERDAGTDSFTEGDAAAARLILAGRLREARDLAIRRLAENPRDSSAHIVLTSVYSRVSRAAATPEDRAVAWLAIDHLTMAIKTGAIALSAAKPMLADLEARTPTSNDLKLRGWTVGQRLLIDFAPYEWIREETTVRQPRS
jgi:hypothetical protein